MHPKTTINSKIILNTFKWNGSQNALKRFFRNKLGESSLIRCNQVGYTNMD